VFRIVVSPSDLGFRAAVPDRLDGSSSLALLSRRMSHREIDMRGQNKNVAARLGGDAETGRCAQLFSAQRNRRINARRARRW
jgi:hypothetical protein